MADAPDPLRGVLDRYRGLLAGYEQARDAAAGRPPDSHEAAAWEAARTRLWEFRDGLVAVWLLGLRAVTGERPGELSPYLRDAAAVEVAEQTRGLRSRACSLARECEELRGRVDLLERLVSRLTAELNVGAE